MEEAVFVPASPVHVVDEVKEHQQMQAWTAEGYISEGEGNGPSSDSDFSGRSWATSELPSPTSDGDDEKWV